MSYLVWDKNLSVGIDSIDQEHQKLFSMINDLYEHIGKKSNNELISDLIKEMKDYTKHHYATEETYFLQFNYPQYKEHKAEHDAFVAKVADLEKRLNAGRLIITFEITAFLKDWIKNHIKGTDMKYVDFLKRQGVK
jgi:hemerythrin